MFTWVMMGERDVEEVVLARITGKQKAWSQQGERKAEWENGWIKGKSEAEWQGRCQVREQV